MTITTLTIYLISVIFLLGICWGSFLNVWIYRIPLGRSVAGGRSACMTCEHNLGPLDLVPLFSFLFLRAKCRYCKTKLSWQYPMIELIVGLLFVLTYFVIGLNMWLWLVSVFVITVNVVMAKIDWNTTFIPNVLSYSSIVIAAIYAFFATKIPNYSEPLGSVATFEQVVPMPTLTDSLIGGFAFFALFFLLFIISNGGMGLGDAKWALFMGLMLGWQIMFIALFIATTLSSIYSLTVMAIMGKKIKALPSTTITLQDEEEEEVTHKILGMSIVNGKPAIVLGPFLAIGMIIAWFYGVRIFNWYMF